MKIGHLFNIKIDDVPKKLDIYTEQGFTVLCNLWIRSSLHARGYRMKWFGVPVYQIAQDLMMMQELIYRVKPDVVIETGAYAGGTAIFYVHLLRLLGKGRVISIDLNLHKLDPRAKNQFVTFIQDDSESNRVIKRVKNMVKPQEKVLVVLDSDHHYKHVSEEMKQYAPLVTPGSYLVVFDTVLEIYYDAPRSRGKNRQIDNPARAVRNFLKSHPEFEPDPHYNRLGITYCLNSFLKRKR